MGKGANYVNNNKGVHLQASKKAPDTMPICQYGAGCSRPSCIYRHPPRNGPIHQSKEPCMAYLAGMCAFDSKGCRKRHPPKNEMDRLITKYKKTRCRFGDECKTKGCLYMHPSDTVEEQFTGQSIAWDNQCQFVPPPMAVNNSTSHHMPYQPQEPQTAAQRSMQSTPTLSSQSFHPQYAMQQQQQQPPNPYAQSSPPFVRQPYSPPPQQRFVPSPDAKSFVPRASSKEFVPGQYKMPPS